MRLFQVDSPVRLTGTSILEAVFRHAGSWITLEVFQPNRCTGRAGRDAGIGFYSVA
nr:hypothetical protein PJ912_06725 [Pectobacterium colocasium]